MTNEEIERVIEIIRKYECNAEHHEACEAIIKALEQPQPCEECKFQGDTSFCDVCCHNYMSMFADKMKGVDKEGE